MQCELDLSLSLAWSRVYEPDVCVQVDREFQVQKALFSAGFPVPPPLLFCSDVEVIGTEFYLMGHVQVSLGI